MISQTWGWRCLWCLMWHQVGSRLAATVHTITTNLFIPQNLTLLPHSYTHTLSLTHTTIQSHFLSVKVIPNHTGGKAPKDTGNRETDSFKYQLMPLPHADLITTALRSVGFCKLQEAQHTDPTWLPPLASAESTLRLPLHSSTGSL